MILGETAIVFGRTLNDPFSISRRKRNYRREDTEAGRRGAEALSGLGWCGTLATVSVTENRKSKTEFILNAPRESQAPLRILQAGRGTPILQLLTPATPEFCLLMSQSHVAHRHFVALRRAAEFRIDKLGCRTRGTRDAKHLRCPLFCHH
jgi:hypothetical protein